MSSTYLVATIAKYSTTMKYYSIATHEADTYYYCPYSSNYLDWYSPNLTYEGCTNTITVPDFAPAVQMHRTAAAKPPSVDKCGYSVTRSEHLNLRVLVCYDAVFASHPGCPASTVTDLTGLAKYGAEKTLE